MQDLSFEIRQPWFTFGDWTFALSVYTFENGYGLPEDETVVSGDIEAGRMRIAAPSLTWANGQETAAGGASILAESIVSGRCVRFGIQAEAGKAIRSAKLTLRGVPKGEIVNLRETTSRAVPESGLALHYPEGWRNLYTPLAVLRTEGGKLLYFRSTDPLVRDKRFVFLPAADGSLDVELIFEEDAAKTTNSLRVPAWEVGVCDSLEEIMAKQTAELERSLHLTPWEERSDVPAWAKDISLVAAIHMQHWNGYIFNDYEKTGDTLEWLAERIEGKRILAYLPGWEGRYYWQYGDYRPDPRMGGEAGFERLMERAQRLGIRVMPMFGMNIVNRATENFEQWGMTSLARTAGGFPIVGSVDWDGSRHYDHGHGAFLHPGAPGWQNRLVGQIRGLMDRYGFDGVFLDISAAWVNDPNYHYYEGLLQLCRRIREGRPDSFVAGEAWYDAAGLATPLMQSGHTDGVMHWHDEPYAPIFDQYNRSFGHLCLGAPGKGSTGVHEHGFNPGCIRAPLRKGIIPTVTIVDDTLRSAPGGVEEIIGDARRYAELYLNF
ncbi:hypothetical protein [Cohnella sp. 56]|uniref:hypothetical protein n=1 Tax=Cohnella sp. 56 TaxID=3113722 RepID=UPI0030E938EA